MKFGEFTKLHRIIWGYGAPGAWRYVQLRGSFHPRGSAKLESRRKFLEFTKLHSKSGGMGHPPFCGQDSTAT
jgi:hypothetical protein